MKKQFLFLVMLLTSAVFFAQPIQVDITVTAEEFFQSQFMNELINTENLPNTPTEYLGSFTNTCPDFPLQGGYILTTGSVSDAVGPNESSSTSDNIITTYTEDIDLSNLAQATINDINIIEFDFIPTTDTISFRYIFASEEFPEYATTSFNDVMGIFLSGPGIEGSFSNNAENIALLPNGEPVTINNIFNYSEYYVGPEGVANPVIIYGNATEFDGATILLTASHAVTPGQVYHLKIAIADTGDSVLDSAFLMESVEFSSSQGYNIMATCGNLPTNNLIEGGENALLITRETNCPLNTQATIEISVSSNSQSLGFEDFTQTVTLEANEVSKSINLNIPTNDLNNENTEITVRTKQIAEGGFESPEYEQKFEVIDLETQANIIESIENNNICNFTEGQTLSLNVLNTENFGTYEWSTGESEAGIEVNLTEGENTFYITATDYLGNEHTDEITIYCSPEIQIDYTATNSTSECNGAIELNIEGGLAPYSYSYQLPTENWDETTTTLENLCPGSYDISVTDQHGCSNTITAVIDNVTSINAEMNSNISVYPNPSLGATTIDLSNFNEKVEVYIFNQSGQAVYTNSVSNEKIEVPELQSGIYYLEIVNSNNQKISKSKIVIL